jgi:uncharacterized flavoprotein (TIGR03862 family)
MANQSAKQAIIIGGGPAGLMAAERLAQAGLSVSLYDRMPSVGRKFLMAGRGGLNLTHSEPLEKFLTRYGEREKTLSPAIQHFSPQDLIAWCEGLGQKTFIGSSGRVFPATFKASPLLRAWLKRLGELGVQMHMRHEWKGWNEAGELLFEASGKTVSVKADATVLALGGASWPKLGANGHWALTLEMAGVDVAKLKPANCGFEVKWSDLFRTRFEGQPLKPVMLFFNGKKIQGETMITAAGIEGSPIYALSHDLRDAVERNGCTTLTVDLKPSMTEEALTTRFNKAPRGRQSLSSYLYKSITLSGVAVGLIHEITKKNNHATDSIEALVKIIKHLPLTIGAPFSIERAISSAGGVAFNEVDQSFMLKKKPGVFVAGEMLNWEAPTGGYLLQGCFSTAVTAADGVLQFLKN